MKEVTLKFIGTGYKDIYQANIKIYDMNNKLIYDCYTYNGYINIYLKECCYYKVNATLNDEILNGAIYINKDMYTFIFNRSYISNSTITTFILTDYNYNNLPIEKGELILWQR